MRVPVPGVSQCFNQKQLAKGASCLQELYWHPIYHSWGTNPSPKPVEHKNTLSPRVGELIPRMFIIYQHACIKFHYRILVQQMERYKYINWSLENHLVIHQVII